MRYLLNAPLLTDYGDYVFSGPLPLAEAGRRAREGVHSAIGHAGTAELVARLLGIEVPLRREAVHMQPGDEALVFRLTRRLPEGVVLDARQLAEWPHEFAWLVRRQ